MKKITLLAFLFTTVFYAQEEWRKKMISQEYNYQEIKEEAEAELSDYMNDVQNLERGELKKLKQYERWKYFWENRLGDENTFENPLKNYKEWQNYVQNSNQTTDRNTDKTWNSLGPSEIPNSQASFYAGLGRLNVVTFDPNDVNVLWVGSPGGGIWKSEDQGTTWAPKGDEVPNLGVSDICVDPNNSNIIYVATGDFDGLQNRSIGVIKSTDGGETWSLTGLNFDVTQSFFIAHVIIDPTDSNVLFATTNTAIYKSTDAGVTWTSKQTSSGGFNDILYKEGDNSVMYATSNIGDFYTSVDSGETWDKSTQDFGAGRLDIALTADDPNFIFGITSNDFFKSENGGQTWTVVSTPPSYNTQGNYNQTLTIAPDNKDLILVGGINGHRTLNCGVTWEKYLDGYWRNGDPFFYVHSDHHDLKFLPGSNTIVFSANDGGLNKGNVTLSDPWVDLSSGLAITQYYKLAVTPQNENYIIGGAQDNDVTQYNGTDWINRNFGTDGVEAVWNYSNSNIAWTCSQFGYVERTTNFWATAPQVLSTPPGNSFVWPLEIHPTMPTILFGGFSNIYKSSNSGTTWSNLSSPSFGIKVITISPSDPNTIYIGSGFNLYKSKNGGSTWTSISHPSINPVTSIAVSDTNPDEIYITYGRYSDGAKVYKSLNCGDTWQNISGDLPNIPMNKVIYKTGSQGEIFVGSDLKVFYLNQNDDSPTWQVFGVGLPNVIVNDMEMYYGEQNRLRVATFGRGIWDIEVEEPLSSPEYQEDLFSLYPNPNKGVFQIDFPEKYNGNKEVIIYNQIGGVVYHQKVDRNSLNIDLKNIVTGVYIVKIKSENAQKIQKIVIQ
ncbi:VPS10 domain-containing protein [Aureivirga sp. CE67]|uniref:T9SS type A sorting domain-containing protein n=1 Tax=Aureivirga sp. CE67 TaxID=1788983 RepID=UPI0018CB6F17|nr:T9SS type A sorting domain-containing protein [Aureivirga sp. CE67]